MNSQKNINLLKLYRKMLHTMMIVFQGDYNTFHLIRINIRKEIEKRREITDLKEIRERMIDLEEARNSLLTQVMQGKLQDGGYYKYKTRPENAMGANAQILKKNNL
jgi:hypothetical protein